LAIIIPEFNSNEEDNKAQLQVSTVNKRANNTKMNRLSIQSRKKGE
jgi:hypothetical protein|tara:strand:+ start:2723 stop:2860 length:138 start_codon:yes stop_codon:yes gene_type:complete